MVTYTGTLATLLLMTLRVTAYANKGKQASTASDKAALTRLAPLR